MHAVFDKEPMLFISNILFNGKPAYFFAAEKPNAFQMAISFPLSQEGIRYDIYFSFFMPFSGAIISDCSILNGISIEKYFFIPIQIIILLESQLFCTILWTPMFMLQKMYIYYITILLLYYIIKWASLVPQSPAAIYYEAFLSSLKIKDPEFLQLVLYVIHPVA